MASPFNPQQHLLFLDAEWSDLPKMLQNGDFVWKFSKTNFFFDILTIHNDQISYVKHVLDPLHVFFTLFGCWRGDGGLVNDFVTS